MRERRVIGGHRRREDGEVLRRLQPCRLPDLPRPTWELRSSSAGGSPLPAENEAFGLQSAEVKVRTTVEGLTVEVGAWEGETTGRRS